MIVTTQATQLPPEVIVAGWELEQVDAGWRAYNEQREPPIQTMAFPEKSDAITSAISMQEARADGLLGLMGDSILRPWREVVPAAADGEIAANTVLALDLATLDLATIPGLSEHVWRRRKTGEWSHFWNNVTGPGGTSWYPFCAIPLVVRGQHVALGDDGNHCPSCERAIIAHIERLDTTTDVGVTRATANLPPTICGHPRDNGGNTLPHANDNAMRATT